MDIFLVIVLILIVIVLWRIKSGITKIKNNLFNIDGNLEKLSNIDNNLERFKKRFVPTKEDERMDEIKSSVGYKDD